MKHEERLKLLRIYIGSEREYEVISEKEYPRYSVFRVAEAGSIDQYQIFKDGTIMLNCKEIINWLQAEKILKAA